MGRSCSLVRGTGPIVVVVVVIGAVDEEGAVAGVTEDELRLEKENRSVMGV